MPKTAQFIAEQQSQSSEHAKEQVYKPKRKLPAAMVPWQWKKGQSGNPGGRVKHDFAADFARKVLEAQGNETLLNQYAQGFAEQLMKGNAYTFKELAERGYGKLKEAKEVTHIYQDVPDSDLQRRMDELIRDLGLARAVDEAGGSQADPAGVGQAESQPQDTSVLPR